MSGWGFFMELKNGVSTKLPKLYHAVANDETRICMIYVLKLRKNTVIICSVFYVYWQCYLSYTRNSRSLNAQFIIHVKLSKLLKFTCHGSLNGYFKYNYSNACNDCIMIAFKIRANYN